MELKDLAVSFNAICANNTTLTQRFASVESAVAALQQGPALIVPAEKRAHYESTPSSTLIPASPAHFEYPHIHSPFSTKNNPGYTSHVAIPNAPSSYNTTTSNPMAPQNVVVPQYSGPATTPSAPVPYYTNTPAQNRSCAIQIGPMKWVNPRDEVAILLSMVPNLKSLVNKNFNVTLKNNALFAKITFSSPFDGESTLLPSLVHGPPPGLLSTRGS
jgi:hypothetical protein